MNPPNEQTAPASYWAQLFEGRLALNPGVFFLCSKAFSGIIFSVIFRASNQTKRIKTEMLFKLSNLKSNLALTLGYFNAALNNLAQGNKSGTIIAYKS